MIPIGEGINIYGHSEGAKFRAFVEKVLGKAMILKLTRIDKGERQDMKTEAAFAAYWNRPVVVKFLESAYYGQSNLLKDHCYIDMTANKIVAALRKRAVWHDKFTMPNSSSAPRTSSRGAARSTWRSRTTVRQGRLRTSSRSRTLSSS